jgi:alpha-D-xyloside xylohydrolase
LPHPRTSGLLVATVIIPLCAGSTANAQTPSPLTKQQSVGSTAADKAEADVDTDNHETDLIPMAPAAPIPVASVQKTDGGAIFTMLPGTMKILLCDDSIVHVTYAPRSLVAADPTGVIGCQPPFESRTDMSETPEDISLSSDKIVVRVSRRTGALTFFTPTGQSILAEPSAGGKAMQAAVVNHEETYRVEQDFVSPPDEALYGMAEAQDGVWNWHGIPLDLISQNITGAFPVLVSSRGYGVIWNNESLTQFNPVSPQEEIPLNASSRAGTYHASKTGDYVFFARGGNGAGEIGIEVGGLVVHDDKNMWVPYTSVVKVHLTAGRTYPVRLLGGGKSARLYGRPLQDASVFRSEVGKGIDYYFIYGPDLDKVVAGYRQLTGAAPLFPKWTYGFWQCREHYSSQDQTLQAAEGFRSRHIPVDLIIQDWQYWGKWGWGSYQFDPVAYPDPVAMISKLHQLNYHYMISVWQDPKSFLLEDLKQHHGVIDDTGYIDELYSEARAIRWKYLKKYMFDLGVDAWWQDGEEANGEVRNHQVYVDGKGYVSGNPYTYYFEQAANQSIYEGQRSTGSPKRVVQLGKSATVGFQRYAAVTWSGDVHGSWQALGQQIPAGLNLSAGGMPYWTTDTGGFFRPADEYTSPSYNRLLVRWFQYSAFCPILRIHGFKTETEMWKWPLSYKYMLAYDKFRYRMLPYIYSEAWRVTSGGGTLMRPLVMDFPNDREVQNIGDQYMFGPAFLVAPVTTPGESRVVYLPKAAGWIDFWTGRAVVGGKRMQAAAPLTQIPLFMRAGAILPLGPVMEYVGQKPEDPLEIRIYPGANGAFTLYEDEGDNYDYEKGIHATIPLAWNDAARTLTIGDREGQFPGMPTHRTFRIVLVRPGHGTGMDPAPQPDRIVAYEGKALEVHLENRSQLEKSHSAR